MPKIKPMKGRSSPMVIHKCDKARELQARMRWVLTFLNQDVHSLSRVECLKLFIDFRVFQCGWAPSTELHKLLLDPESDSTAERRLLTTGQEKLRGILQKILMTGKQLMQKPHANKPQAMLFVQGFEMYEVFYNVLVTEDRVFKDRISKYLDGFFEEDKKMEAIYTDTGILADALIDVLSQFPLSRIKTCQKPDCGNYFFQKTTKSKGDFCSPKCQNWARAQRYRENHRDEYNAYYRSRRSKAKEPRISITCLHCGHQYPKGHPDPGKCSKCGGNLRYEVQFLEDRQWKSEECRDLNEAEELRKEIVEFEEREGRETNAKR
ncbi:MAG: CGNR zinc finger domain-containing protein [Candidatus Hodarchaeota archaeon]